MPWVREHDAVLRQVYFPYRGLFVYMGNTRHPIRVKKRVLERNKQCVPLSLITNVHDISEIQYTERHCGAVGLLTDIIVFFCATVEVVTNRVVFYYASISKLSSIDIANHGTHSLQDLSVLLWIFSAMIFQHC